jgi:hypothetical protein
VGINHIDCKKCNNLYDDDIVDSIMLCVSGPVMKIAKATPTVPIYLFSESTRSEGLDRCDDLRAVAGPSWS